MEILKLQENFKCNYFGNCLCGFASSSCFFSQNIIDVMRNSLTCCSSCWFSAFEHEKYRRVHTPLLWYSLPQGYIPKILFGDEFRVHAPQSLRYLHFFKTTAALLSALDICSFASENSMHGKQKSYSKDGEKRSQEHLQISPEGSLLLKYDEVKLRRLSWEYSLGKDS